MARQEINIGTVANDGTGDPLRTAMDKTNDNFEELYGVQGWGFYQDAETTPATQTITTTPSILQIDGGGANTETNYLPAEILGIGDLWDTTNDKIDPIGVGDSYALRVDIEITAKSGNPDILDFTLDIGGTSSITIPIVERIISTGKTPPYSVSIGFPVFTLTTFNTNGGQIFLSTDTGTITIGARAISIYRISKGQPILP